MKKISIEDHEKELAMIYYDTKERYDKELLRQMHHYDKLIQDEQSQKASLHNDLLNIRGAWDKLLDKTDDLHDLDCGCCDDDVQEFVKTLMKVYKDE